MHRLPRAFLSTLTNDQKSDDNPRLKKKPLVFDPDIIYIARACPVSFCVMFLGTRIPFRFAHILLHQDINNFKQRPVNCEKRFAQRLLPILTADNHFMPTLRA